MSEVSAKLVAEGVGLPLSWMGGTGEWWEPDEWMEWGYSLDELSIDLSDPQTAFGLAMKLDEWGARKFVCAPPPLQWTLRLAYALPGSPQWVEVVREMAAHIEHIGRDHAVRRALGWEIARGTLAKLENIGAAWVMWNPCQDADGPECDDWHWSSHEAASITDPAEARRVIYEAVCP